MNVRYSKSNQGRILHFALKLFRTPPVPAVPVPYVWKNCHYLFHIHFQRILMCFSSRFANERKDQDADELFWKSHSPVQFVNFSAFDTLVGNPREKLFLRRLNASIL